MKKYLLSILVVLALATSIVYAQHHGNPPDEATRIQHHVDHMTKALGLTPAQAQQATALLTSEQSNAKNFHDQMRAAHDSLKAAVQKNDAAGIDQAAATIGNITSQMVAAHAKGMAAFQQTLTPDQQTKLNSMMEHSGPGMFGHFGPGGMAHPRMSHEE